MDVPGSTHEGSREGTTTAEDGTSSKPQKGSVESQAASLYQRGLYRDAVKAYTICLAKLVPSAPKAVRIGLLINRSAAHLKLKHYDKVYEDCDKVIQLDCKHSKAQARLIKALCSLGHFTEALYAAKSWLEADPSNIQAQKEVERLSVIVNALQDQDPDEDGLVEEPVVDNSEDEQRIPPEGREDEQKTQSPSTMFAAAAPAPAATSAAPLSPQSGADQESKEDVYHTCTICDMTYLNEEDLRQHFRSDIHKKKVSSNDGQDWKHRPPPRGLTADEYSKCPRFFGEGTCRFGFRCSQAHSEAELDEWRERFEYRRQRMKLAKESDQQGNSYADQLMEKLIATDNPDTVMTENLEGVNVHVNNELSVTTTTKRSSHFWLFTVTSKMGMACTALLDDTNRSHFYISAITVGPKKSQKTQKVKDRAQDWRNPSFSASKAVGGEKVYRIRVVFRTDIYGTFRQSVVFDFGCQPVLVRQLCVESSPVADIDKLNQDLKLSETGRWDLANKELVKFHPLLWNIMDDEDHAILDHYPAPLASRFTVSEAVLECEMQPSSYRQRMHDLLYIEEMAQFSSIAKYNIKAFIQVVNSFMLIPSSVSTAKYAQSGQLFARLKLNSDLSEDTSHGRLVLQNVNTVYLSREMEADPDKVYEALVEDKCKSFIYLRLSATSVTELSLQAGKDVGVQVQFQLNRLPLCEMHQAVDKLPTTAIVFPEVSPVPPVPWNPASEEDEDLEHAAKQWAEKLDSRLNTKQREAVVAITTDLTHVLPPILIIGPYGTGKTFTLAQAAIHILQQENTRVLICTHSNSAADLYIKDYLHPYVESGHEEARPLRVVYRGRWIQTLNPTVLDYCLHSNGSFRKPTKEDIETHRVTVVTLSTSRYLYNVDILPGWFTHILLDEAAQAQECETIMPFALAGPKTRIVLAGDHMQLSPEIHSDFARERNMHISLLERLYDRYPADHSCKILLCENYRSHKAIIDYTSELFYDNKLVASGNQPRHEIFYPLTFFTARGEDVQHQNSTTFYNNAEVYEIVERVSELQKMWPKTWGTFDETGIGVVSPYADQVVRIRAELRKRKMFSISVERVLNVQGKQFRAIFLSTVRTRHTCGADSSMDDYIDYGFLSNVKLLNTAITRAQSLVAVVGDPVSLCSIGKCRKLWERFLELCNTNNSLYGTTWNTIRAHLDGVELKKTYVLNPLAPEFIPNRLRHAQNPPPEPIGVGKYGISFAPTPPTIAQRNPYFPHPVPPHLYYSPVMPVFGGVPGFPGHMQSASMWTPHGHHVQPRSPYSGMPHRPSASAPAKSSPSSAPAKPKSESGVEDSTSATTTAPIVSPSSSATPTVQTATGVPLQTGAKRPVPQQGAPVYHPMPHPTSSYGPSPVFYPPQGPGPYMMSPRGPGMIAPGMPPHLPPGHHPLLGQSIHRGALPPFSSASHLSPHGYMPQQNCLPPPSSVPVTQRLNIQTSTSSAECKASVTSPSSSDPGTPKIQFLPDVKNGPSAPNAGTSNEPVLHNGIRPGQFQRFGMPYEQAMMHNMFLQRELYRYILQREGVAAANAFLQTVNHMPPCMPHLPPPGLPPPNIPPPMHSPAQESARAEVDPTTPPDTSKVKPKRETVSVQQLEDTVSSGNSSGKSFQENGLKRIPYPNGYNHNTEIWPEKQIGVEGSGDSQQGLNCNTGGNSSQEDNSAISGRALIERFSGQPPHVLYRQRQQQQQQQDLQHKRQSEQMQQLQHFQHVPPTQQQQHIQQQQLQQQQQMQQQQLQQQTQQQQQQTQQQHIQQVQQQLQQISQSQNMILPPRLLLAHSQQQSFLCNGFIQHPAASISSGPPSNNFHKTPSEDGDGDMAAVVGHMVRFIDDTADDPAGQSSLPNSAGHRQTPPGPPIPAERPLPLYMRRAGQSGQEQTGLSYAGALRRQAPAPSPPIVASQSSSSISASSLLHSVHLPRTAPSSVLYATAHHQQQQQQQQQQQHQVLADPLDLLKNLNIKASPGTQAFYQYFS